MRHADFVFVDFAKGDVSHRNNVVPIGEALAEARGRGTNDYITVYRFPPEYLEHCRTRGSVSGYAGPAYADYLPIDIDREDDLFAAHQAALRVAVVLNELFDVDASKVRYFFSGAKGYHLLIPTWLMGRVEPGPQLPAVFRSMAKAIAEMAGVEIDGKIYDVNRLFRIPDTKHGRSGLWKVELTWDEFSGRDVEAHRQLARQPRLLAWDPHDNEENEALVEFYAKHAVEVEQRRGRGNGSHLSDGDEGVVSRLALTLSPSYCEGSRHELVLAFAGYAAKRHLPREAALGVIEQLAAGDDELSDRLRAVEDTYDRVREGMQVRGYTDLARLVAGEDLAGLRELLGDRQPEPPATNGNHAAPPPERSVPTRERVSLEHVYDPGKAGAAYLRYARELVRRRVEIGIPTIDRLMRGLMPGTVTTIVAKSRVGKSIIAQNIRRRIAGSVRTGGTVFFSLEMPIQLVWERDAQYAMSLSGSGVEQAMRDASEGDAERYIAQVSRTIPRSYTVTAPGLSLEDMTEYCDLIEETFGHTIIAVLVDYLSLIRGQGRDIYTSTSMVARGLKSFAKEVDAPVIVLAQVRRRGADGEKIDGSVPPTLEDPRDSGAIEEGSDSVIGAWRPKIDQQFGDDQIGFRLLKNRMGVAGSAHDVFCAVNWTRLEITELLPDELPHREAR